MGSVVGMATTMMGNGLYDATEVALLCGLAPDQVVRWSTTTTHGDPAVSASFDRLFSFADLIALTVARQVRENGVSDRHLRKGVSALRSTLGIDNPLASEHVIERLATSGDSFLAQIVDDDYEDIGRGGQGTFQEVIKVHLKQIQFDGNGRPTRWTPIDGVSIDPAVQAGAPCIEGTRIPTRVVAERATVEPDDDIAFDLDLELAAVEAAVRFEELLALGAGIPA
jgi:uncharacterized protein (DUF433 family)/DNA-binding transcriptional MerR regulator